MKQIIILDFGNDYNQDLIKVIEEQNIRATLLPYDTTSEQIASQENVIGIILSGGYSTKMEDDLETFDGQILNLDMPILGLGRGMQVIIDELGGTVKAVGYVYEPTPSKLTFHNTKEESSRMEIGKNGPTRFDAAVSKLPEGFKILASGQEVKSETIDHLVLWKIQTKTYTEFNLLQDQKKKKRRTGDHKFY